jgi:hypothetical protein
VRIGTWNLEYAAGEEKNRRRHDLIASMRADVWVLTETHDDIDLSPLGHRPVHSRSRPTARPGGRWATIWSRYPVLETISVCDPVRTTAALLDSPVGALIVFGTVLPWHTDPGPRGDARAWTEHHRVIPLQGAEWACLRARYPGAALCVAGDLNTNLGGRHSYGTKEGRSLLRSALDAADLVCATETDRVPEGKLRFSPIDHVCLSKRLADRASVVEAWEGRTSDGSRLSDHSGLVVEVASHVHGVPPGVTTAAGA